MGLTAILQSLTKLAGTLILKCFKIYSVRDDAGRLECIPVCFEEPYPVCLTGIKSDVLHFCVLKLVKLVSVFLLPLTNSLNAREFHVLKAPDFR